ncbi:MAG: UvrD-helicase domain-containing protein, partial [Flammeovirgaceae bacterium]
MTEKPFHIYRSSAGSGKTRVLAREYIQLALKRPDYFKYILAMTFTNKSTQEMKERILKYLHDFAKGDSADLANEIITNLREEDVVLTPTQVRERSEAALRLLLHRYSEFSVSTIDAFFQRIIRAFTRETGLLGNFRLEVENDLVVEEAVNLLMDNLSVDEELRGWVLDYSIDKLEQGERWDIRTSLISFASLLKLESFKAIEDEIFEVTQDKLFFRHFKKELNKTRYAFENYIFERAKELYREIAEHNLSDEDFAEKSKGVSVYIRRLTAEVKKPNNTVLEIIGKPEKWAQKKSNSKALITSLAHQRWQPKLSSLVSHINDNWQLYQSVKAVSENLHSFGLLADLVRQQKKYLNDENLMLLSDASKFLNQLVRDQDASFLYEKVGSFYRHYLIDEFQDTSSLQWKNLLPLVQNGIAQNYKSLIVGDIKQSIYRWRGGDLSILQSQIKQDVSPLLTQMHALNTNYRSEENIVRFNNLLFQTAAKLAAMQAGTNFPVDAYSDSVQHSHHQDAGGYVNIEFLPDD